MHTGEDRGSVERKETEGMQGGLEELGE